MANTVLVLPVTSCSPQRVLPLVCLSKDISTRAGRK